MLREVLETSEDRAGSAGCSSEAYAPSSGRAVGFPEVGDTASGKGCCMDRRLEAGQCLVREQHSVTQVVRTVRRSQGEGA